MCTIAKLHMAYPHDQGELNLEYTGVIFIAGVCVCVCEEV